MTKQICILIAEDTDSNYDLLNAILGKQYRLVHARWYGSGSIVR